MKNIKNLFKNDLVGSVCISGILFALILVLNFVFDLFKVWSWSIQMFLIVYSIGIYKIKNIVVNIFFILIIPPILFLMESGPYVITALQTFFEYFLVFYIFSLLAIPRFIINKFFLNSRYYKYYDGIAFIIFFSLLIVIKFFFHAYASLIWWKSKSLWIALIFNAPWLATNSLLIPVVILIVFPIFKLFNQWNLTQKNRW